MNAMNFDQAQNRQARIRRDRAMQHDEDAMSAEEIEEAFVWLQAGRPLEDGAA